MKFRIRQYIAIILLILVNGVYAATENLYRSPNFIAVNKAGTLLFISEETSNTISVMDINTGQIHRRYNLSGTPGGLICSEDQNLLYVTCGQSNGVISSIDLKTHKINDLISAGHTPTSPILDSERQRLYVSNRYDNRVSVIDLKTCRVIKNISVLREPIAAMLTQDGNHLFVVNHLPDNSSSKDYAAAEISVIDTERLEVFQTIRLPDGSTAAQGICLSPDGKFAYVTHIMARYKMPTTQIERGWINTNAISIINVANFTLLNTILLDDVDRGAANPWQPTCSADGKYLCISHSGSHELSVIDQQAMLKKLALVGTDKNPSRVSDSPDDVPYDLTFLTDIRQRISLPGKGPRGLAIVDDTVYVAEFFSDTIAKVKLTDDKKQKTSSLPLGPAQTLTAIRKGNMLFHDAGICYQQWQSCASCHPGQGRVDGLNWDLLNDGSGNPKNTKSLLYSHRTAPAMALGVRADAESAVRSGINHILFAMPQERDAVAIDAYLKSLKPIASPHLVNDKLSISAQRGGKVFESAKCVSCHNGEMFTNQRSYDVGTGTGLDKDKSFDTPTLIELWRTAPYLNDGRAKTVYDIFKINNKVDEHGTTSNLTDQEIQDLAEYILSL
ncbi:MAG: c-type cytochrome [Phycisphaerae bacterium]|nr:c-type cytochrome [Phycisphaerae bacterium]